MDLRFTINESAKHQKPSSRENPMSKSQNRAAMPQDWSLEFGASLVLGAWCLVFGVWCLVFGAWCFHLADRAHPRFPTRGAERHAGRDASGGRGGRGGRDVSWTTVALCRFSSERVSPPIS